MAEIHTGIGQDGTKVFHHLFCFLFQAGVLHFTGGGINTDLAGNKKGIIGKYGLIVGANGCRSQRSIDDRFSHNRF